jgi:hypothetical protein
VIQDRVGADCFGFRIGWMGLGFDVARENAFAMRRGWRTKNG